MKIKIFIRTTELRSQALVAYLKSKKVEFSKVDVSINEEGYQEMLKKSGQRKVPVIEIGDRILVGFNKFDIDELLTE